MKKLLRINLVVCCCLVAEIVLAQTESYKRELRGVWIASVANIDWPSKPGLSSEQQKQELIRLFDSHQRAGINVIFLQVRPAADALYAKSREPWSRFLTGREGRPPVPFYDPLAFAIEEAHSRGMELHAWINPYRATFDLNPAHISSQHISKKHPAWFFQYGGKLLFDPGIPEVRDYISEVVLDIVRNYDIDGIHLDDYFYPYPDGNALPDARTFRRYGQGFSSIDDWRRNNVNQLIRQLSIGIRAEKSYIKFGVSPFGIWDNKGQHPEGSETSGFSGYRQLYADAKKWAQEGWVDYLVPQIYFPFNYRAAAFETLVDWWSEHAYGRHLYVGHAAYRISEKRHGWEDKSQLPRQIEYIRNTKNVQGSVFFSSKSLTNNLVGFRDMLQYKLYQNKSLPPAMPWLDSEPPSSPRGLTVRKGIGNSVILHWQQPTHADPADSVYGYVVYRFNAGERVNLNNAENILYYSYDADRTTYTDDSVTENIRYTYVITALDRLKNESEGSNRKTIMLR